MVDANVMFGSDAFLHVSRQNHETFVCAVYVFVFVVVLFFSRTERAGDPVWIRERVF